MRTPAMPSLKGEAHSKRHGMTSALVLLSLFVSVSAEVKHPAAIAAPFRRPGPGRRRRNGATSEI
jgi:hypothetical protein